MTNRIATSARALLTSAVSCAALLSFVGCSTEKTAPAPVEVVDEPLLCPTGLSEDPPRSAAQPGIVAFADKNYAAAQKHFTELSRRYPGSAATRAWLGDAILFDKDRDEKTGARDSRPFFEEAQKLHDAGCKLQRRPRYYLLMGEAYGSLRLAKTSEGYDERELERAELALIVAQKEFPTSAEVPYNLARVSCARSQLRGGQPSRPELDRCLEELRLALEGAERLDRPRFLRTHRSTQDWIVRSRTQSEFGPLRADPRYDVLIRKTLDLGDPSVALGDRKPAVPNVPSSEKTP